MEGLCLATRAIIESETKVGYMFREKPDFDEDTGWRFFTGEESLDFIDDDDNIEVYEVSQILKKDESIREYLESPVGTEWEKDQASSKFNSIKSDG